MEYISLRRLEAAQPEIIEKGQVPCEAVKTGRITASGHEEYIYGNPELVAAVVAYINNLKYYDR